MLLTRSPLGTAWCCHQTDLARLACVKHAASVRPEPGSNSPSETVESFDASAEGGHGRGFALVWNSMPLRPSRLTILTETSSRGWAAPQTKPRYHCAGSSVARMFQSTVAGTEHIEQKLSVPAPFDGVEALAFHTLLSFQGASWERSWRLSCWFPRRSRRRSGGHLTLGLPGSSTEQPVPGSSSIPRGPSAMPPELRAGVAGWSSPRYRCLGLSAPSRRQRFTQKSRPAPPLLLGVRTATDSRRSCALVALGDLLSSALTPNWRRGEV